MGGKVASTSKFSWGQGRPKADSEHADVSEGGCTGGGGAPTDEGEACISTGGGGVTGLGGKAPLSNARVCEEQSTSRGDGVTSAVARGGGTRSPEGGCTGVGAPTGAAREGRLTFSGCARELEGVCTGVAGSPAGSSTGAGSSEGAAGGGPSGASSTGNCCIVVVMSWQSDPEQKTQPRKATCRCRCKTPANTGRHLFAARREQLGTERSQRNEGQRTKAT